MTRDEIIIAQLDRIEAKQDKFAESQQELSRSLERHQTSIGFLKAAVGGLFTTLLACLYLLFPGK